MYIISCKDSYTPLGVVARIEMRNRAASYTTRHNDDNDNRGPYVTEIYDISDEEVALLALGGIDISCVHKLIEE